MTNGTRKGSSDKIPQWWPVIMAAALSIAAFSSLQTQAATTKERIDRLELLAPTLDSRLVRIETEMRDMEKAREQNHATVVSTLSRLEMKLDAQNEKGRP